MTTLFKYFHELVDFWSSRTRKLRYTDYGDLIDIEAWWELEKQFEILSFLFIDNSSSSDQEVLIGFAIKFNLVIKTQKKTNRKPLVLT